MSKRSFWAFLVFYLVNLIMIVLVIGLWTDNRSLEIALALYLLVLTGFFSYANRKKKK